MKTKKDKKIIYSVNEGDIQDVANEVLDRRLSKNEIDRVSKSLGDHIDWFQAIWDTILAENINE